MYERRTAATSRKAVKRVMAYCHDSVGIGHLRRTLSICERVGQRFPEACFLLATGTPYAQLFKAMDRVDCIKLPALAKVDNATYRAKNLSLPIEKVRRCREAMLLQAARCLEPDILLVDKAPLGVCRELLPTLEWVHRHHPDTRVIFGMRDIEDAPAETVQRWRADGVHAALEHLFDEVWVYGMRDVFDVVEQYQLSDIVRSKLRFMGYVCKGTCRHKTRRRGCRHEIVVTVGGGTDGERMLATYLAETAQRAAAAGACSTIIGGPDLPAEAAQRLRTMAARLPKVTWVDFEPCMSCRLQAADLVVSMGGYNTMCELAVHRKPAVIIPRIQPRLEQAMRAELWAKRCAVSVLLPQDLTPATLAERVLQMLQHLEPTGAPDLDVCGLDRVESRFAEIWSHEVSHASALCL